MFPLPSPSSRAPAPRGRWLAAARAGRGVMGALGAALGCVALAATANSPWPVAEAPVLLPPWVIEETSTRAVQAAREDFFAGTLGPTAVVTASEWSGRAIGTLAEALRRTPGVMLQESFGGFEPPRLSLRGSGLDSAPTARGVALLADGLPLARADGSFHSGLFDPLLFSRVEVYRGTLHVALTPAVLGGVLHAVTQTAGEPAGTSLRVSGGDFGQSRIQAAQVAPQASVAASLARSRGWREHSEQDRRALVAGAHHPLSTTARLELSAYLAAADYDVPGPLTLAEALVNPRAASVAARRDLPRRAASLARIGAQVKSAAPEGALAAGVAWLRLRDDFFQLAANGETEAESNDLTTHATVSRRANLAGAEHHLLARATYSTGVNGVGRFLNDRAVRGARFGAYDARASTAALSVEDLIRWRPDLAVGAGLTAVHARRRLEDRFSLAGSAADLSRAFAISDLSPRLGLTWQARRELTWRLALSEGIEPPSFDDLVAVQGSAPALSLRSRELRGQRAATVEVGAEGRSGAVAWTVTAYQGRWQDEILRLADASGLPRGAINAGATRHQGIESAVRWRLTEGAHALSLAVTSTVGRFVFAGDPVYGRQRIAGAPPHVGSAELTCEHPRGFFSALESTWVAGRTSVDHAGRLGYGGHSLLHGRVGWRQGRRVTVFLAVRNVLDHAHVASTAGVLDLARAPAATTIFLPGPSRAVTLGLEWKR